MASPSLRSTAGESSADAGEPIEGAADGWAQPEEQGKTRDSAHAITRVNLRRGRTEVGDCLAIRL